MVEGKDYELSGDFSASEIGSYTVTICGIGNYTGFVDKTYNLYCSHQFGNWIITKQPTVNSTGTQKRVCSLCEYEEEEMISKLQSTPAPTETGHSGNTVTSGSRNSDHGQAQNTNGNHSDSSNKKKVKKPSKVTGLDLSLEGRKLFVSWNWKSDVSGFQIQYAQNKKFTKKKKIKNTGKYAQDKTLRGLKRGTIYYVRIRAYKKVSGKKVYGKWSKVKKVRIK